MTPWLDRFDSLFFRATGRLVAVWCSWTGRSNFTLAKVFLLSSLALFTIPIIVLSLDSERPMITPIVVVVFLPLWSAYTAIKYRALKKTEEDLEKLDDRTVLPASLRLFNQPDVRFNRLCWIVFGLLCIVFHSSTIDFTVLDGLFDSGFFSFALHLYAAAHFNKGERSKLKTLVLGIVRRIRSTPAPAPKPSPKPVPA